MTTDEYWMGREADLPSYRAHWTGLGEPFCAACGWSVPPGSPLDLPVDELASLRDRCQKVDHARYQGELTYAEHRRLVSLIESRIAAEERQVADRPRRGGDGLVKKAWSRASRWLDRAHLVDRVKGGLDHAGNVVPMCQICHEAMPSFDVDEWSAAVAWVNEHPLRSDLWQLYTDCIPDGYWEGAHSLKGPYRSWLELMVSVSPLLAANDMEGLEALVQEAEREVVA